MHFESDHGPIVYDISGPEDAPAVVCTHGLSMDRRTFDVQVEALSDQYRVLTWDMPGHGESVGFDGRRFTFALMAECLVGVMDDVGIDRAALLGVSLGSLVNQYVAYHHPERVTAVIDVGGLPLHKQMSAGSSMAWRMAALLGTLIPEKTYYRLFAKERSTDEDTRRYMEECIAEMGKRQVRRFTNAYIADQTEGIPAPPEQPLLIINGEEEISFVATRSQQWHEEIPNSRRVVIDEAGHIANQDNPEVFNQTVATFLQSVDERAANQSTHEL